MTSRSIVLRLCGIGIALALILTGFPLANQNTDARTAAAPSFTLTIGGLEPVTGELSSLSQPLQTGAQVAVSQINKALKASGSSIRVKFTVADSQGDATAAVSGARQLLSQGATCINGPATTFESIPVVKTVLVPQKVPMINPDATSVTFTELGKQYHSVYRIAPPDNIQGKVLALLAKKYLKGAKGKKVAFAGRNDPYGTGLSDFFSRNWKKQGGTVEGPYLSDQSQASYDSVAAQIVNGNPAGLAVGDYPDTFGKLAAALLRTGKFSAKQLFFSDTLALDSIPSTIPAAALNGAHGTTPDSPSKTKIAKQFNKLYKSAKGAVAGAYTGNGFDAVMLCAFAALEAHSNSGAAINKYIRPVATAGGLKFSLLNLKAGVQAALAGKKVHYIGVTGPLNLDKNGDPTGGTYDTVTYVNGSMKILSQQFVSK
jgi:ABC-type branched-subunit amino acid transport system substrate-binding protein